MGNKQDRRLGKGLEALLGEYLTPEPGAEEIRHLPVSQITPNPFQPRRDFSAEGIDELSHSIRENGLLHPLMVRPAGDGWQLISGDRRLRAVKNLGWVTVPCLVREIDERAMLVLALVENLQRDDLSPLEEAEGYRQLVEQFGLSQTEVAERLGKDRSTVANALRLLSLPPGVKQLLQEGRLTAGHARALLALGDERLMMALAHEAAEKGLSVREVEGRVRLAVGGVGEGDEGDEGLPRILPRAGALPADAGLRRFEEALARGLGTSVRIRLRTKHSGRIEIPFGNSEEFERLLERILGPEASRQLLE